MGTPPLLASLVEERPSRAKSKTNRLTPQQAEQARSLISELADAAARKFLPPLDGRLKSIVASQIGTLLKGGYPFADIRETALRLALAWDELRGHNRLTHLQQRVRILDVRAREKQRASDRITEAASSVAAMASVGAELKARGLPLGAIAGHSDVELKKLAQPSNHAFTRGDVPGTCRICGGPVGVHITRENTGE